VGGHYGEEIPDYLAAGFDPIDVFEPLAANCDVIRKTNNSDRVRLYQVALGSQALAGVPMFVSSNEAQSSSLLKPTQHTVQYPSITFDKQEVVDVWPLDGYRLTPDLLAMDTQGYELEVLKGATETLKSVKVVYTEVSNVPLYEGSALVEDLDEFLQPYGFKRVRTDWVGVTWGDAVYVKIP